MRCRLSSSANRALSRAARALLVSAMMSSHLRIRASTGRDGETSKDSSSSDESVNAETRVVLAADSGAASQDHESGEGATTAGSR